MASAVARAEAPITSDFAIRVNATLMRDLLASQIGAELGASVTLGTRIDAGLLLSLGRSLGGRLGLTWHMQDDGEWFRPFLQARALLHPVPEGIAGGGGAWGGVLVRAGPGRIQGGVIFEAYFGPKGYVPYDVFVTLGYELDLYRRIEREGVKPPPDFGGTDVLPLKPEPPPVVATPEPTLDVPKSEPRPPPVDDRTKVVTHVSLAKDLVTFDERRASWNTKGDTVVRRVIEVLKRYPQLQRVEIAGHADDADNDDECLKLSQRRAQSVLDALVRAGIEPNRLTAKGYGKLKNRVPVKGPARKREPNRRVDFIVLQEG